MANIALVGFMGVGKTSIAKKLAMQLGYPFVDLDEQIEREQGISIAEIFERYGEKYFRQLEEETLNNILSRENIVLATGGGVVTSSHNRQLLEKMSYIIQLTATPQVILQRVKHDGIENRPILANSDKSSMESITKLLKERQPFYDIAQYTTDTSKKDTKVIVEEIIAHLKERGII